MLSPTPFLDWLRTEECRRLCSRQATRLQTSLICSQLSVLECELLQCQNHADYNTCTFFQACCRRWRAGSTIRTTCWVACFSWWGCAFAYTWCCFGECCSVSSCIAFCFALLLDRAASFISLFSLIEFLNELHNIDTYLYYYSKKLFSIPFNH